MMTEREKIIQKAIDCIAAAIHNVPFRQVHELCLMLEALKKQLSEDK